MELFFFVLTVVGLYFLFETLLDFNGTARIVIGSILAGYGLSGGGETVFRWILISLGLIIALRGVVKMVVQALQPQFPSATSE